MDPEAAMQKSCSPAFSSLATDLFREVRPDLFRVLAGQNAAVYLDVLDALERESAQRVDGMTREDALGVVSEIVAYHPGFVPEEGVGAEPATRDSLPVREKARCALDYLGRCGWLEVETGSDWHRVVRFDAHGVTLMAALRKIARPDAAVFTDKLVGVCAALANHAELARHPLEHVQACQDNAQQGIAELLAMQKGVERLIRRQVETRTLGDNLSVVFDQYAEQIGHACYAQLAHAQLGIRLVEARERLMAMRDDSTLSGLMQHEMLRRNPAIDASEAMARVRNQVLVLARALDRVLPLADSIDSRTAEFTRRSLARFRYMQEVVGERRSQVKSVFESINDQFSGKRFADFEGLDEFPGLFLPEARLMAGRDSLYEPAKRRFIEQNEAVDDEITEAERDQARLQMENALRDSLTVSRANGFVQRLPGSKGARVSSEEFPVRNEDDLADVMALLLHAESAEARYRVEVPRVLDDAAGVVIDRRTSFLVERFVVVKK